MIQFIIPGIAVAAYGVYKYFRSKKKNPNYKSRTKCEDKFGILLNNISRLEDELKAQSNSKCLIIGQPGSGKSTLLWKITNKSCFPKPKIGVATDATDWAEVPNVNLLTIYNDTLFIDTPGYGTVKHPASLYAKHFPFNKFNVVLLVLNGKIRGTDNLIINAISNTVEKNKSIKCYVVRTYSENFSESDKSEIESDLQSYFKSIKITQSIIFVCNKTNNGLENIRNVLSLT